MSFAKTDITYRQGNNIEPTRATKESIERYARSVAETVKFEVGDNPEELASAFGGRVHFQDIDDLMLENGSIVVHAPNDFDISLPHYTSARRDNFTIAHELGHYFLHSQQGTIPIIALRSGSTRIEWEANWFGAAVLMPSREFMEVSKRFDNNIDYLADHFNVSHDAARIRLESLDG